MLDIKRDKRLGGEGLHMNFFKKVGLLAYHSGGFLKSTYYLARGLWHLYDLPKPIVTIFGGHNMEQGDKYARQAYQLASSLVEQEISVITGGGPGIMQAANCGAKYLGSHTIHARTLGIGIKNVRHLESPNPCAFVVQVNRLYIRKLLLINYSKAFVVFPGGVGTFNELSELLTLIDIGHIPPAPIVLVGSAFWTPFIDWFRHARAIGLIHEEVINLLTVTDDNDTALQALVRACGKSIE